MRGKVFGWLDGMTPLAGQAEPLATLPSAAQVLDVLQLANWAIRHEPCRLKHRQRPVVQECP